jgi:hypothetical protein
MFFNQDSNKQPLNWIKLDNGTYRAFITLGISDQLLEYLDENGQSYFQYIDKENLFDSDSLKSAYGMPVTFYHPLSRTFKQNKDGQLVGACLESFLNQDGKLLMPVTVLDQKAIELIDQVVGTDAYIEASPGYFLQKREWDETKQAYKQIKRKYDHIALLPVGYGRAGQEGVLRTDAKDFLKSSSIQLDNLDGKVMIDLNSTTVLIETMQKDYLVCDTKHPVSLSEIDNKSYISKDDLEIILNSANAEFKKLKDSLNESQGIVEGLKIQIDSKKDLLTIDDAKKLIEESIELWNTTLDRFVTDSSDFKPDYSLKPIEIKKLYIQRFHNNIELDNKSDAFIDGIWSVVKSGVFVADKSSTNLQKLVDDARKSSKSQADMARETRAKRIMSNGYKK